MLIVTVGRMDGWYRSRVFSLIESVRPPPLSLLQLKLRTTRIYFIRYNFPVLFAYGSSST
jgi:hypothetical protein